MRMEWETNLAINSAVSISLNCSLPLWILIWLRNCKFSARSWLISRRGSSSSFRIASFLINATRCEKRQVEMLSYERQKQVRWKSSVDGMNYFNISFIHRTCCNHRRHAITTETVTQHRGHHGISIGYMRAILFRQSNDHLFKIMKG